MSKYINQHVFEIRYKPNPKILDYRGTWAEKISAKMQLAEWRILENRVDIYDKSNKNHAFVGFRNLGYSCNDSPTKNYFYDQAIKLFSFVVKLDGFDSDLFVDRIGVRSKFCSSFEKGFEELVGKFGAKYLCLTEDATKILHAKIIDIGAPLNFVDGLGNFNTMCGPMKKGQTVQFFSGRKETDVPEVGLYFDVDYFLKPNKKVTPDEIKYSIKSFAESSWEKHEKIKTLLLGD